MGRGARGRQRSERTEPRSLPRRCTGTTWADVDSRPADYQVVVVMSVQPQGPPSGKTPGVHLLPLLEATGDLVAAT